MELVVDIGNTNIVIGIKHKDQWRQILRFETDKNASEFDYSLKLNNALWELGISPDDIAFKVMSSVVPELNESFQSLLNKINKAPLIHFDKSIFHKLPVGIPAPDEIGTDLVANTLAAYHYYKEDMIIIDFGTALTFTVLNKDGKILGVNITPGIKTAMNALGDKTSQLDAVPLEFPVSPLGNNTETAIQNGVLIGYTGLISYMIKVLKNEVGQDYKVLATGGLVHVLKDRLPEIDYINQNLTLEGLALATEFL